MDPLDWIHQWDDYEMYLYAESGDADRESGIFMQVSKSFSRDGATLWEMLYERRLCDVPETGPSPEQPNWEDAVLRTYLHEHPNLVADEKKYLETWLESSHLEEF